MLEFLKKFRVFSECTFFAFYRYSLIFDVLSGHVC